MKRLIGACLILAGAMLPLAGASAKDLNLAAFFGTFKGSGVSENRDSLYFGTTIRDLDVTIQPAGKGFTIEWTTVIRRGGDVADIWVSLAILFAAGLLGWAAARRLARRFEHL